MAGLVLVGAVKLGLLICLGLFEVAPGPGTVETASQPSAQQSSTSGSKPKSGGSWTVRTAQAQEPQQGAKQAQTNSSLSEEWEALNKEKRRLKRKQESLQKLEKRLDEKLAREKKLKSQLEQILKEAKVMKNEKIKHLVDVYSNMQPEQAAKVLETVDQDIAVKILAGMRGRTAGEILSFVQAKKAARLSEQLTDFQTPFAKE